MLAGIVTNFVTYATPERPLIDCFRMGGPVGAGKADAITAMPSGADAVEVVRMIPIDPGARDWVLLCDNNVKQVRFAGAGSPTVKPVNGRAAFTMPAATDNNIQVKITATGPVINLAMVRAEHEEDYLAGQTFNPNFVDSIKPFRVIRTLDWDTANAATFPAQRPLPSDAYFTKEKGGLPAEYAARVAARIGAKLWYPINPNMPDAQINETLVAIDRNAGSSAVDLEWGNEVWNSGFPIYAVAAAKSTAAYGKPDLRRFYGHSAGMLALLAAKVSPRFKVNLCWQNGPDATNLDAILVGWDETKAPRDMIAGYGVAPYINGNRNGIASLLALQAKSDADGFYAFMDARRAERAPWFATLAAAVKSRGIAPKIYEHGPSIVVNPPVIPDATTRQAFLDWAIPLVHSERMAAITMQNMKDASDAGFTEACFFQHAGVGGGSGIWGARPHVSLDPYPIYTALTAPAGDPRASEIADIAAALRGLAERVAGLDVPVA